jgi:16S rRNA (guanine527-N7)-methyltransferase
VDIARIAELLQPFLGGAAEPAITTKDLEHISTYIDLLLRWNARINLTAIRDPEQIVTRHFGESFYAARQLFPSRSSQSSSRVVKAFELADLGSGAGFPGLAIKLWFSQISLTLIESNHKKAAFLREVTRALTLTNVNVLAVRAQHLCEMSFDLVTLRAVERFLGVLPIASKLLAPAGRLALLIGSVQLPSARHALPGLSWSEPIPIPLSNNRVLVVGADHGTHEHF